MIFLKFLHICIFSLMISHLCFAKNCKYAFIPKGKDQFHPDPDPYPHPVFTRPIDVFGLSVRANKAMRAKGIYYLGDVIRQTEADLSRVPRLNKKDIRRIKSLLSQMDLRLGTDIEWPADRVEVEALVKNLNPTIELTSDLVLPIDTLGKVSSKAKHFLKLQGIYYLKDLVAQTEVDLIKWQMEKRDIIAIMEALATIELRLGLNIEWPADPAKRTALAQKLKQVKQPPRKYRKQSYNPDGLNVAISY